MKKYIVASALFMVIASCNNAGDTNANSTVADSGQNPSAIDTTQHPNGLTNGSVISTDTAAMRVQPAPEN